MRVPPFERHPKLIVAFAIFCTGFICGCAVYMSLHQHHFNLLVVRNANLQSELDETREDLRSQANLRSKQSTVAQVKVLFDLQQSDDLDEWTQSALRKAVHQDLQTAVGSAASSIRLNPQVFLKLADGKLYSGIRGKEYRVRVQTLIVVQTELSVWITAKEYVKPSS
ncbi:hypothetical protein [Gorillibacterium timonense]|uniref:hypothetical protein n=1 Tax=Gorillibacterium timonense TaxID=1689269 RepID=UPI00071DA5D6|nr:hypothetical protein [Gorillibacterium timonense]